MRALRGVIVLVLALALSAPVLAVDLQAGVEFELCHPSHFQRDWNSTALGDISIRVCPPKGK